jgi:serine/threonine protein phosphatase PrpC
MPNDDRSVIVPDRGFFAVADAAGPTYGGWHRPARADVALRAAVEAWSASPALAGEVAMVAALRRANDVARDPKVEERLTHTTSSITALGIRGGRAVVGQVGLCRAYRARGGALQLLLEEHSVARANAAMLDDGTRDLFTHAPGRLIGFAADVEVDLWTDETREGDVFVLCTDGVWGPLPEARILALCALEGPGKAPRELVLEATATDAADCATSIVVRVTAAR